MNTSQSSRRIQVAAKVVNVSRINEVNNCATEEKLQRKVLTARERKKGWNKNTCHVTNPGITSNERIF